MKQKTGKALLAIGILPALLLAACTPPWQRREMVEFYSDDSNYVSFTGKIVGSFGHDDGEWRVDIIADPDEFQGISAQRDRDVDYFSIVAKNYQVLESNGFELVNDAEYIFTSSSGEYWYNGFHYPIVEVKSLDGEITYLDFETGKSNYIDYVKNELS